jgi:hypothetical protein
MVNFLHFLSCCTLLCFVVVAEVNAQSKKYWVFLTDKDTVNYQYDQHLSEEAIERRTAQGVALRQYTDIPLKTAYLQTLQANGFVVIQQSKWLNAVTTLLTPQTLETLKQLPFVKQVLPLNQQFKILATPNHKDGEYALAIEQMEAAEMKKVALNGEGITLGIIDAGFVGASQNEYLQHLFDEKRIMGVKDLVNPRRTEHFKYPETNSDGHGNTVLQMVAGYEKGGSQYGFATKAKVYLARTDHGDNEFRGEEDYWVAAMGYALGFDNPAENYKPEQMDGKTSTISKATNIAANEKGLLLIVSAGNEGNDYNWQIVSTPADSPFVVSVGATQPNGLKAGYSSIGPEFLTFLKPNVACFSTNGTSYAAPVITGFAACLMQKNKQASNKQIIEWIEKASHLYPFGNNYLGYGIPKASKALKIMEELATGVETITEKAKYSYTLKLPANRSKIQVFHKKSPTLVLKQDLLGADKGKTIIIRPASATHTTIVADNTLIEIIWEGKTPKQVKKAARKAKRAAKKEKRQAKKE